MLVKRGQRYKTKLSDKIVRKKAGQKAKRRSAAAAEGACIYGNGKKEAENRNCFRV